MYRILLSLDNIVLDVAGWITLSIGFLLAMALYVLVICPLHNYVQARVARANGDEWIDESGYLTMNPVNSFHWIGALSVFVNFMGFSKRVRYRRRYFDAPFLGTLWLSLSGILVFFLCSVVFIVICAFFSRFNSFEITSPLYIYSDSLPVAGRIFHTFYSMMFFISRMCIYSALINVLPVPPLDMGELVFTFLGKHWSDLIKKNDAIISIGVFILAFFVLGMPDSLIPDIAINFIRAVTSATNFIINMFY
ncbi:MAG: hypothetical protein IJ298_09455 [Ruminococcus sp.]|nr:hypothetical protein [Ruminococcus sp.]